MTLCETIEEILKELVGGIEGYETRILASKIEDSLYRWTVYLVLPREKALASWDYQLSCARAEKSKREGDMAGYMEQFKAMSAIAANLLLLRKSGPVKDYRRAKKELEELSLNVAELETKVKELGTYGYWVQEFPSGKYAVYPYPSVLEVTASYGSHPPSVPSLTIILNSQLKGFERGLFQTLSLKLGTIVRDEWPRVDVVLNLSDRSLLYTIPLADARAKEAAARKELEKKPAEKKHGSNVSSRTC